MNDPAVRLIICNRVSKLLNKELSYDDIHFIQKIINKISNDTKGRNINTKTIIENIPNLIVTEFNKKSINNTEYDMREYIINNIGVSEETGIKKVDTQTNTDSDSNINSNSNTNTQTNTDINLIQAEVNSILLLKEKNSILNLFNPVARHKSKFIVLDSINQDDMFNGSGLISWDISSTRNFTIGTVNTSLELKNIIGMRMMPPRLPYSNQLYYMNQLNQRWTILIQELQAQAYIGPDGRKFHFMMTLGSPGDNSPSGNFQYWDFQIHNFNKGYFWFRKPFTNLIRMTLSFGCPWYQFKIKNNKAVGITSTVGGNLFITFPNQTPTFDNSNLPLMYAPFTLSGFTTTDPVTDAATIAYVNSHTFTSVEVTITPYTIQLLTVSTVGLSLIPGLSINVYSKDFRMIFPMEIIYLDDDVKDEFV
jgi:hypothetical protein